MALRLQDMFGSKSGVRLGLGVARCMAPAAGHRLARTIAWLIVRFKPEMYRTMRSNLAQVLGGGVSACTLEEVTYKAFVHAGQSYYDFFRAVRLPRAALVDAVQVPDPFIHRVRANTQAGRGVLLLGLHMSNFDLAILSLGARGLPMQALSLADPGPGFRILNELRAAAGIEITPITAESLHKAIRRLRDGGIVFTGVDRPVVEGTDRIEFFGRPSYLPLGPVRLALLTEATVFVGGCCYQPDSGYRLRMTGPVELVRSGHRREDILASARRVAAILEEHVSALPEQWLMFHPMWPE